MKKLVNLENIQLYFHLQGTGYHQQQKFQSMTALPNTLSTNV